jgi:hypothetical protein
MADDTMNIPAPPSGTIVDSPPEQAAQPENIPAPPSGAVVDADPLAGKDEERAFLAKNPDHAWMPADPKFPNRPEGIYPTGKGNEWRTDPTAEQHPIDLHFAKHTAESAATSALAVGAPIAAMEAAPALVNLAVEHLAGNVLPGMEKEAAKQVLIRAVPHVAAFAKTMGELGIGIGGLSYMLKTLMGGK